MPMRKDAYPAAWLQIARAVKVAADWRCQDCGMQCWRPGEPFDTHRRTMSVMHLDHNPQNCAPDNLRPACSKCHLAYDLKHHMANAHREMVWFSPACIDPAETARTAFSRPIRIGASNFDGTLFQEEDE